MVQKFYAIRNEKSIETDTVISTFFAIVVAGGCYFLGGFGRLFSAEIGVGPNGNPAQGFDSVIPEMLRAAISTDGLLMALVVVLVLSASMSTLSSLVMTSSSTLTIDFVRGTVVKDMRPKSQVLCIRILLVVFIAISAALALVQYNSTSPIAFIAQMMGVSWGAMAGSFLAPFLYALYSRRVTKASVWTCFAFALALTVSNVFGWKPALWEGTAMNPIHAGAIAMLAGLVIVPVVSLFTPKPERALVDGAFACYDRKTVVPQSVALGEED
jgi:Na+/proline symporter